MTILEGKWDHAAYMASKLRQRAVERGLEIIGEAMNKPLKVNPEIQLSSKRMVVALRNQIIHAYDSLNHTIIWKIIMKDLPILLQEVPQLLL